MEAETIQKCDFCKENEATLKCTICGKFCCLPCSKNKTKSTGIASSVIIAFCPKCGGSLEYF